MWSLKQDVRGQERKYKLRGYGLKSYLSVKSSLTHSEEVISPLSLCPLVEWKVVEGKNLSDLFSALSLGAGTSSETYYRHSVINS